MSFVYPRTVSVTRPSIVAGVGNVGYVGLNPTQETPVAGAQGMRASIQYERVSRPPLGQVPGDATTRSTFKIFLPDAPAPGLIQTRDIVTDDLGQRYQVTAPYWDSLGYTLRAEMLQA